MYTVTKEKKTRGWVSERYSYCKDGWAFLNKHPKAFLNKHPKAFLNKHPRPFLNKRPTLKEENAPRWSSHRFGEVTCTGLSHVTTDGDFD